MEGSEIVAACKTCQAGGTVVTITFGPLTSGYPGNQSNRSPNLHRRTITRSVHHGKWRLTASGDVRSSASSTRKRITSNAGTRSPPDVGTSKLGCPSEDNCSRFLLCQRRARAIYSASLAMCAIFSGSRFSKNRISIRSSFSWGNAKGALYSWLTGTAASRPMSRPQKER